MKEEPKKSIKIDLGAGMVRQEGWTSIDKYQQGDSVDIVMDLDNPRMKLPFKDNSVDEIKAHHVLEHIDNLFHLINECYRVLIFNGHMDIIVPLGYVAAFGDPSHVRAFSETSFHYFTSNPPGNYHNPDVKGYWKILLNDWTPPYTEDTTNITVHKQRELHVYLQPEKEPLPGWDPNLDNKEVSS